ncbi:collagen alpha-2(I) chain-like [Bacillus rossius redtenbacheri]|uniref:collagen alpha-2(I) chain-like n=1 Tax=Bacillus rossius redtenbacheri TaxID=93214 RepID=UPI002FDF017C
MAEQCQAARSSEPGRVTTRRTSVEDWARRPAAAPGDEVQRGRAPYYSPNECGRLGEAAGSRARRRGPARQGAPLLAERVWKTGRAGRQPRQAARSSEAGHPTTRRTSVEEGRGGRQQCQAARSSEPGRVTTRRTSVEDWARRPAAAPGDEVQRGRAPYYSPNECGRLGEAAGSRARRRGAARQGALLLAERVWKTGRGGRQPCQATRSSEAGRLTTRRTSVEDWARRPAAVPGGEVQRGRAPHYSPDECGRLDEAAGSSARRRGPASQGASLLAGRVWKTGRGGRQPRQATRSSEAGRLTTRRTSVEDWARRPAAAPGGEDQRGRAPHYSPNECGRLGEPAGSRAKRRGPARQGTPLLAERVWKTGRGGRQPRQAAMSSEAGRPTTRRTSVEEGRGGRQQCQAARSSEPGRVTTRRTSVEDWARRPAAAPGDEVQRGRAPYYSPNECGRLGEAAGSRARRRGAARQGALLLAERVWKTGRGGRQPCQVTRSSEAGRLTTRRTSVEDWARRPAAVPGGEVQRGRAPHYSPDECGRLGEAAGSRARRRGPARQGALLLAERVWKTGRGGRQPCQAARCSEAGRLTTRRTSVEDWARRPAAAPGDEVQRGRAPYYSPNECGRLGEAAGSRARRRGAARQGAPLLAGRVWKTGRGGRQPRQAARSSEAGRPTTRRTSVEDWAKRPAAAPGSEVQRGRAPHYSPNECGRLGEAAGSRARRRGTASQGAPLLAERVWKTGRGGRQPRQAARSSEAGRPTTRRTSVEDWARRPAAVPGGELQSDQRISTIYYMDVIMGDDELDVDTDEGEHD